AFREKICSTCFINHIEPVKLVERRAIDRNRQQFSIYIGQNTMFIGPPTREAGKIRENLLAVCVEYMWAIFMDEDTGFIAGIKSIPRYMRTTVAKQYAFSRCSKPLSQNGASKTRPRDQIIIGIFPIWPKNCRSADFLPLGFNGCLNQRAH